jgi:hypothetical protein
MLGGHQFYMGESLDLLDRLIMGNTTHPLPFFIEAAMVAAWELWKLHNDKVFPKKRSYFTVVVV